MTVENLEIKVKTDAGDAATQLRSIASAIGSIETKASGASGGARQTAKAVQNVGEAAKKANKPLGNFISSLKRIVFYRIIRSIIKDITGAFSEGLNWAYQFSAGIATEGHRFAEALDSMKTAGSTMKAQIGSAFIGLLAAIAPVINQIISLVTRLADALSQIFAVFTGSTYLKAATIPQKWADAAGGAGRAAKEWKNQLLGFDEINRLNEPSQGGGGGSAAPIDPSQMFTDSPLSDWAQKVKDNLALIETVASGFALGIGLILLLSGANIPLGLGLVALGALGLAHALTEDWSAVDTNVATVLHNILFSVGSSLLAVGAVLAFSGANIPLGIGLMAVGAASLFTAAAIRWGLDGEVGKALSGVARTASMYLFAIGLILALTGVAMPLGVAMMGASIVGYATTIDWDSMLKGIKGAWQRIKDYYNEHIKKFFTKEWWQEKIDNMLNIRWPHIPLPHFSVTWEDAGPIASFFGFSQVPHIGVQFYAEGGFPTEGSLFFANEAGPELVGTMGGRNAVANQQEITEGIRQGVYDAVTAAMSNGERDINVKVYLDSREIKAGQERLARAWG